MNTSKSEIIKAIIEKSSTCSDDYFDNNLMHGYLDLATSETKNLNGTPSETKVVWSMRVGILDVSTNPFPFIDLYLAYPDESVGSDSGNEFIPFSFGESFESAYLRYLENDEASLASSLADFNSALDLATGFENTIVKEPVKTNKEAIIAYLKLWDELLSNVKGA